MISWGACGPSRVIRPTSKLYYDSAETKKLCRIGQNGRWHSHSWQCAFVDHSSAIPAISMETHEAATSRLRKRESSTGTLGCVGLAIEADSQAHPRSTKPHSEESLCH